MRYKKCSGKINLAKYCQLQKNYFFLQWTIFRERSLFNLSKAFFKVPQPFFKVPPPFYWSTFLLDLLWLYGYSASVVFSDLMSLTTLSSTRNKKKTDLFADFLRASQILKYIIIYNHKGHWWRSLCSLCIISNYYYQLDNLLFRNKKKIS